MSLQSVKELEVSHSVGCLGQQQQIDTSLSVLTVVVRSDHIPLSCDD